jgi:glycosyltransferase involved in cell wall biosynthesis
MEAGHVGDFCRNAMILFLANRIGGTTGGPSANLDILTSISATGYPIGIITFQQDQIPRNKNIPNLIFSYLFSNWPPSKKEKELICLKLNRFNVKLVISSDLAFHNLFHFAILPNIRNSFKTIVINHTQPIHYPFNIRIEEVLKRLNDYNHFITLSERVLDEWKKFGLKIEDECCHHIPNCCSDENAIKLNKLGKNKIRESLGLDKNQFISVCVASLQKRKNQRLIIDNLKNLIARDDNTFFYFIGPKSMHGSDDILELIEYSPHRDNIKLIGEVSDAMTYIKAADLLILPSLGEVMPLTILEAMALKTPVLASKVGGIPEMIDDKISGFTFDVNNTEEFVEKFLLLKKCPEVRASIAENAYQKYYEKFAREVHFTNWNKLINSLLSLN